MEGSGRGASKGKMFGQIEMRFTLLSESLPMYQLQAHRKNQIHTKIETIINSREIQKLFDKGHVIIRDLQAYSYVNITTEY